MDIYRINVPIKTNLFLLLLFHEGVFTSYSLGTKYEENEWPLNYSTLHDHLDSS